MQRAGHVIRIQDDALVKQVWEDNPDGKRPCGHPKKRWKDEVNLNMNTVRVGEEEAEGQRKWRQIVGEAEYQFGYK